MSAITTNNMPVQNIVATVTCSDLSLPLEMRHPLTVLRLLQFVDSYNEYAPSDELIHMPSIPMSVVNDLLASPEIDDLTVIQRESLEELLNKYRYDCPECEASSAAAPAQATAAEEGAQSVTGEPPGGEGSSSA